MPQVAAPPQPARCCDRSELFPNRDCINARQRNRAKRSLVVARSSLSHVPNHAQTGARAATLADSVHGTPQRQTHRWRDTDSNPRSPMGENQLTRGSRLTATGVTPGGPILAPADLWR